MPVMSKRSKRTIIALGSLAVLVVIWFNFVGVYVDYLWFKEVGFTQVFTTQVVSRVALFLIAGIVAGAAVFGSLFIAYKSRPVFVPTDEADPLGPYRTIISTRPKLITIGVSVLVGFICGISAQAQWTVVQLWLNSQPFGQVDAEFGNDVGFYIFTLPMIETVLGWLFVLVAMSFIAVLAVQYLYGGVRTAGPGRKITASASMQLSLLVGAFVLIKAVQYWYDRYSLLFSNRSDVFTGASYTDVNAVLPAKLILLIIAAICAVGFFVGAFLRSVKLPAIALSLLILSGVLIGGAWPLILQSVRVNPNAITLESQFISRNIDATRSAYGIGDDKVEYVPYETSVVANPAVLTNKAADLPNARLLDPNVLSPTFVQLQQLRNFYNFSKLLSVDRYTVDGKSQDYVVAVRELDVSRLDEGQSNWINEHLVYTHGNGFVAAPASDVEAVSAKGNGYPKFQVSDVENQGAIKVDQPRVYYGQLGADYAIVGASAPSADTPVRGREYDTQTDTYTYTGSGGVGLGSLFQRLVFATQYRDTNFLLSSEINDNSKILYQRDPVARVKEAAPFLTTDTKPYPAVIDGRIKWIVDGYTTAANFPYAQNITLSDATQNSQQARGALGQTDQQVSYMRNSVKATVDAYDGTVTLYGVDDTDPILKAWEGVFPGLITPSSAISDDLRAHFRYPQDLFEVQRSLIAKYQVTNPTDFYQTSNFWQVPNDPTADTGVVSPQPPYYLQVKLPGTDREQFELTSALTGFKRDFMGAYISASSDPATYGKITVLKFPTTIQTPGPAQVQQAFRNTDEITRTISQLALSSDVVYGNLLTLPTEQGLLYVEPIYVKGTNSERAFPQLNMVLVWFGSRVGYGATLKAALEKAASSAPVAVPDTVDPGTPGTIDPNATGSAGAGMGTSTSTAVPTPTQPLSADAAQALVQVDGALKALESAKTTGSFAEIGAAQDRLNDAVQNYLEVAGPSVGSAPNSAPATSSGG
ncbi:membrane protein [Nakamurella antarctica]|uniref:UPF0182 protein EH165_09850 n=2 Tax=Nakamurella antarctica TaxID=1902245 RepID=A0A3G8ZQJ8_9ACTN|nr:membrane protein [Nakamurella antarctica]